jgi:hypothetical protein
LTTSGIYKKNQLSSDTYSEFLDEMRQPINNSVQNRDNTTERTQLDNQLTYKQLFKKKNRQLIASLRFGIIDDDQKGIILTNTNFYKNNVVDSTEIADQQKIFQGSSKTLGSKVTFSEPLTSKWALVIDYAFNQNASISHRNTYNKSINGKYENLDPLFSNNFDLDAFSHSSTVVLKYTDKKLRAAFGSGISTIKLKLFNIDSSLRTTYNFLKLTPQASIGYTFKPQTNLSFNYRGTTRQPTIEQLQPIRDNTDRLNVFEGNPNLKVGFNHNFSIFFNTYKMLSQKGFFGNISYNIPVNAISFYNLLDVTTGKQVYTPVNVNGNRNWNVWMNYFKDGGEKKLGYSMYSNASGGRNINFVNGKRNTTKYVNSDLNLSLRYSVPDKKTLEIGPRIGYNTSTSSLNKDLNSNYWNYGGRIYGMIMLPYKIELNSSCEFDLRQQLNAFQGNPNKTIWNASVSKKFFKDNSGRIYFIANDLLNQNIGFNRTINSNFISEDRYSKISRYFLLKFEWSFNKMPGATTPKK